MAFAEVDRSRVETGGGACFESSYIEAEFYKTFRQRGGGGKTVRPAFFAQFPGDGFGVQINSRRNYDRAGVENSAVGRHDARDASRVGKNFGGFALDYF